MAAFDTTRTSYGAQAGATSLIQSIVRFAGQVRAWNDARATRKMLATLSDRQLDDIGMVRSDIDNFGNRTLIR